MYSVSQKIFPVLLKLFDDAVVRFLLAVEEGRISCTDFGIWGFLVLLHLLELLHLSPRASRPLVGTVHPVPASRHRHQ